MRRRPEALEEREFDLLVIGAGIFGAAAALDAAQRGLTVAVIERSDFGGASSAHSYKLLHGGMRYLQHVDLRRVRQSANARRTFLRIAPHLTRPLPVVVPTYGHGKQSKLLLRTATALYDALTFDRNRGIGDPTRRVGRSRSLSRREVLEVLPGLAADGLTGAVIFYDGQMYNPPRLVLAFLRSAAGAGAVVANYVRAKRLLCTGTRVRGVEAEDTLGGGRLEIRSQLTLNAAGVGAEELLTDAFGRGLDPPSTWSRDAYFVVRRRLVRGELAVALPAATHDPESVLSRGARHLFLSPWQGRTLVGVWHKVHRAGPDTVRVTDQELERFIAEVNAACPALALCPDDVALCVADLILFGENPSEAEHLAFGHRSRLVDHSGEHGVHGLVTLIGVRYTTGPTEAAHAVDLVCAKLGRETPASRCHVTPLYGGAIDDFEALVRAAEAAHPNIERDALRALVHNHGTAYAQVLSHLAERPELARPLGESTVLSAEIVHAVRQEMAMTLADVAFRRTDLATAGDPGPVALEACARLMAHECGWTPARRQEELAAVAARLHSSRARPPARVPTAQLGLGGREA